MKFLAIAVLGLSAAAYAESGPTDFVMNFNISTSISNMLVDPMMFGVSDYQIGSEWGKEEVTRESLDSEDAIFRRAARATARFGGGTAFYLGKFNGHHIVATNYHVMDSVNCRAQVQFPMLGKNYSCGKIYGVWKEIDLSLFSMQVPATDEALLQEIAQNFSYNTSIYPGQEVLTIGFGVAGNPGRRMMANRDSDCKVFSGKDEFRLMADPDELNPGDYSAWSFANGCDVSHGDSGSSYVDRKTGDVLGIVWTGKIPKPVRVRDSKFLDEIFKSQGAEIWTDLTFSVPAVKMREHIQAYVQQNPLQEDFSKTLLEVVNP